MSHVPAAKGLGCVVEGWQTSWIRTQLPSKICHLAVAKRSQTRQRNEELTPLTEGFTSGAQPGGQEPCGAMAREMSHMLVENQVDLKIPTTWVTSGVRWLTTNKRYPQQSTTASCFWLAPRNQHTQARVAIYMYNNPNPIMDDLGLVAVSIPMASS